MDRNAITTRLNDINLIYGSRSTEFWDFYCKLRENVSKSASVYETNKQRNISIQKSIERRIFSLLDVALDANEQNSPKINKNCSKYIVYSENMKFKSIYNTPQKYKEKRIIECERIEKSIESDLNTKCTSFYDNILNLIPKFEGKEMKYNTPKKSFDKTEERKTIYNFLKEFSDSNYLYNK